jgi:hypothetical protein
LTNGWKVERLLNAGYLLEYEVRPFFPGPTSTGGSVDKAPGITSKLRSVYAPTGAGGQIANLIDSND